MSWTLLVIEESLIIICCLTGLRYSLFANLTFICLYPFIRRLKSLLKKCFSDLNVHEVVKSSGLVVRLKLKCLLMKPTHDDTIEAKEVYIQMTFGRYKGKLVLRI